MMRYLYSDGWMKKGGSLGGVASSMMDEKRAAPWEESPF